jgi:Alginate lyase
MMNFYAILLGLVLMATAGASLAPAQSRNLSQPQVFLLNSKQLSETRASIDSGTGAPSTALAKLEEDARKSLAAGPFSVVSKEIMPPSGDKHDYMSQAPYFWPDPKSANGLPYIRRDGERNPEINKLPDHRSMDQMVDAVSTLALAYYLKHNEAYAAKATQLLRAWFLDSATRMNPNLQFGQAIPGINTGRGIGLIETRGLTRVVDAIGLLAGSKAWKSSDQRGLEKWFADFLQWMQEHKYGRDEAAALNNHGTYYDVQTASFALFLGKRELAKQILEASKQKRIARQIEPDGRQPLELARTRAWSYSVGNLDGLILLATLGGSVGVDLWNYETGDHRSIRRALEYLYPYAVGDAKWPHQQIIEFNPQALFPLMRRAAAKYKDEKFRAMMARVPQADAADRGRLVR